MKSLYRIKFERIGKIPVEWLFERIEEPDLVDLVFNSDDKEVYAVSVSKYICLDVKYKPSLNQLVIGEWCDGIFYVRKGIKFQVTAFETVEELIDSHFTAFYDAEIGSIERI